MSEDEKTFNVGDEVYSTCYEVYGKIKAVHKHLDTDVVIYYIIESEWGEFTNNPKEVISVNSIDSIESEVL